MKKTLLSLCTLFLLTICFFVPALASDAPSYSNTTSAIIEFHDIPWEIAGSELLTILDSFNISYEKETRFYGNGNLVNSSSSSFGDGKIIPRTYSELVETYTYHLNPSRFSVAGYGISYIDASFFSECNNVYSGSGSLYELYISIDEHELLSVEEQYDDLRKKLTTLYGEPYFYQVEEDNPYLRDRYKYTFHVWLGSNSTAVYLKRSQNLTNTSSFFSNNDYISLNYGLTSVTEKFEIIDAKMQAAIYEQEQKDREAITTDYSGL